MSITKWLKSSGNRGNIAIIVAISLTVLIGILALVIDGGYLYASKNKWQNGVEAAAMAGVSRLCDGDVEATARQIAQENGLPFTAEDGLTVQVGYYDAGDKYEEDFSVYKDFVADDDDGTEYNEYLSDPDNDEYEFNNAVMVSLNADIPAFLAGIFGKENARVSAAVVGYAVDFDLLSLSGEDSIIIDAAYEELPDFWDCRIHSNHNISCPDQPVDFGDSVITASGSIYNAPGLAGVDTVSIPPLDWDLLKQQASDAGTLMTYNSFAGGSYPASCSGEDVQIGNNRGYIKSNLNLMLELHDGDHSGAIYYYSSENDPDDLRSLCALSDVCNHVSGVPLTNFTIASEIPIYISTLGRGGATGPYGGEGDERVSFFSLGNIKFENVDGHAVRGVILRTEKKFEFTDGRQLFFFNPEMQIFKMKIIADEGITIEGPWRNAVGDREVHTYAFTGNFMPPCSHHILRLGRLENSE